jgi:hypothetical protein
VVQAAGRVDVEPGVPQNLVVEAAAAVGRAQPGGIQSLVAQAAVAVGKAKPGDTQSPEIQVAVAVDIEVGSMLRTH